jgi:hypothetical protein
VLLFSAGVVTLFPSSAVLVVAVMALMIVPFVRNRNGRTGTEPRDSSPQHVANVIMRVLEKLRRLGDPVLRFAVLDPGRAWRLVVLEAAFQLFAVAEVYLTLALITPQHVAWSAALALETVSRAVTILFKMLPMRLGVDEAGAAVFADRLGLGSATGITLALVRRMRSLCWSAVGILLVLTRSTWRSSASGAVAISSARP